MGWVVPTLEHCRGGLCWVLCGTMSERGSLQIQGLVRTPPSLLHISPDTVLARVKGWGSVSSLSGACLLALCCLFLVVLFLKGDIQGPEVLSKGQGNGRKVEVLRGRQCWIMI